MADSPDKFPRQDPANGQHGDLFLTSLIPRLPGILTLRSPIELAAVPGLPPQSRVRKIPVTKILKEIPVPIANEWEKSNPHGQRFITEVLLPQVVAGVLDCQVLNGDGSKANKGLFFRPSKPSTEHDRQTDPHFKLTCEYVGENLLEFYLGALDKYRRPWPKGAGREPTHIILPVEIKAQLMNLKKQSGSQLPADDLGKLWNLHILASDFIPKGRGLVLAIDDMALVSASYMNLGFSQQLKYQIPGWSIISVILEASLVIASPQSIMILDGLGAMEEAGQSQEKRGLSEEPVVESKHPFMETPLHLRKMFFNRSQNILRRSRKDKEGSLDLSTAYGSDADKVKKELQSCHEAIRKIDCLVEDMGNKNNYAFKVAKKDWDTCERMRHYYWLNRFPRGKFIFRGQSDKWPVTSSLYRSLSRIGKESCLPYIEERILTAAKYVTLPHTPESEIFANLQHFGGMTNYIDFTASFAVALYFACKGNPERDGEVFIVRSGLFSTIYPIGQVPGDYNKSTSEDRVVTMAANNLTINRSVAQRNIFMCFSKGYIAPEEFDYVENIGEGETEDFMVLTIKAEEKRRIMGYLRRSGLVEKLLFFEDIIGIIERDRKHERPCEMNEDILHKFEQYDNMETEMRWWRASAQKISTSSPPKVSPRYHIGRILYGRGCYGKAVEEFKLAMRRDQSREIPLQLVFHLASSYVRLGDYQQALKQLSNVKGEACNHLYHFIAADVRFRLGHYLRAWRHIKKAVAMNQASMTYLRLKILIADKLNCAKEVENSTYTYLAQCAYDPEITKLRNKAVCSKTKRS